MWNTGAGKGHHGPSVELAYFRMSSQGWPHGGDDLDQKEQALRIAEETCTPARRNRKWLQGDEGEEQTRILMLGLGKVFGYFSKNSGSHKSVFPWGPTSLDLPFKKSPLAPL